MSNKSYTFLLTSNRKGNTKSMSLSAAWVKTLGVFSGILVVILAAAAVDYVGLLLEAGENKRLKAENIQLASQFKIVESKVNSLENSLVKVNTFDTKIKLITNIGDEDRTLKLSMGGFISKRKSL